MRLPVEVYLRQQVGPFAIRSWTRIRRSRDQPVRRNRRHAGRAARGSQTQKKARRRWRFATGMGLWMITPEKLPALSTRRARKSAWRYISAFTGELTAVGWGFSHLFRRGVESLWTTTPRNWFQGGAHGILTKSNRCCRRTATSVFTKLARQFFRAGIDSAPGRGIC